MRVEADARAALDRIEDQLDDLLQVDAPWCRQRIGAVRKKLGKGQDVSAQLDALEQRCTRSAQQCEARKASMPRPAYDPQLPITAHRDDIVAAIDKHQVLVIAGETGSGKTTQIPKMCIEAGRGVRGMIGCTQPRRIAARAMADRVAEELHTTLGELVGYQVRFREKLGRNTLVKFMTDGILLAETHNDRRLDAYDTIIVDEAHERSLNIDFLIGYLKRLLPRRPDLRVIVTSATIDTEKFARHFDAAPVIEVSGRGYPVDVVYQPLEADGGASSDRDLYQGIARALRHLNRIDPMGDTLVFLSGEREIHEARDFLKRQHFRHTEVLPLFARLSAAEQRRVFHPGPERRIILSTNVAETSLTVPRIRFVIDSGLARVSRYSHASRVQRLPIEAISRAAANQRKGRCGRLGPGVCVRLYSEEDFEARPEFTEPEILRTSLASVILRMLVAGLGSVERFPFLDRPPPRMVNDAYHLLFELGAIDKDKRVVELGRRLARWPVDVRLARMLIEGASLGCLRELLVLAAALTIQDPRERPLEAREAAEAAHARFDAGNSDFAALLKLWEYLVRERRERSGSQFRKLCGREFLNWQRVNEWFDLERQLRELAGEGQLRVNRKPASPEKIHMAVLAGLLSNIGKINPEDGSYTGPRSKRFRIFPGSGLFGQKPQWLMAAEIVETSKTWSRINAAIEPAWIEQQGAHLLRRHYFDPHWSRSKGRVIAFEQVSLFGLVIVERRPVDYGRIDPAEARRLFIRAALVRGELDTRARFMRSNRKVREEIEALEHKRRKHDVLVDEADLSDFFDARIPPEVCDSQSFERWLGQLGEKGRARLYLSHDVLLREQAGGAPPELYPDDMEIGLQTFPLRYHFEPGDAADGVTLTVPLAQLNTLQDGHLQWLVPGLQREKVTALIRALPKPQRRALTPAPQFAEAALQRLQGRYPEPFLPGLAAALSAISGLEIEAGDFAEAALPEYLRMRVEVIDGAGRVIAGGRDLEQLQSQFGDQARRSFMDEVGETYRYDGEREWVFGDLPESVVRTGPDGKKARAWPGLVEQQDGVGLRLFATRNEAVEAHHFGVLRLLELQLQSRLQDLRRHHGLNERNLVAWGALGSTTALLTDLAKSSLALAAAERPGGVRGPAGFEALLAALRVEVGPVFRRQAGVLDQALGMWRALSLHLDHEFEETRPHVYHDMRSQLDDMVYDGFLADLSPSRLEHYPRYLRAMQLRLESVERDPQRDAARLQQVQAFWQQYLGLLAEGREYDEAVDRFRWLIEEFRVSLFAQQLGTSGKVSPARLRQAWRAIG